MMPMQKHKEDWRICMNDKLKLILDDEEEKEVGSPEQEQAEDEKETAEDLLSSGEVDNVSDAEDSAETVESDLEEPEYASEEKYNELIDAMADTDLRLFLINEDMVIPGKLGDDSEIKFLECEDTEGDEFYFKDAPSNMEDLLKFNTLYNNPDKEVEVPHEKIVEYILSQKVEEDETKEEEPEDKEPLDGELTDSEPKEEEGEEDETNK